MNLKLLTDLYKIYSPSHNEGRMSRFVQEQLDELGVEYELDKNQIFSLKKGKPLISCHMDQVGWTPTTELTIYEDLIWGDSQIGADDKNGIWICLMMLKHFGGNKLSFIFSTGEEAGCDIDDVLEEHDEAILDSIPYGLVFDRQGNGDIIGVSNDYCKKDLQNDVYRIGIEFGYIPCMGVWSDADIIAYYDIPCVNLSVGYYRAHTDWEFTNTKELNKALYFGIELIKRLNSEPYQRTDYFTMHGDSARTWTNGYGTGYSGYFSDSSDDDWKYGTEKDYMPFYCLDCDDYLDELDITDNYLCRYCGGEILAAEDYEYEIQHYSYEEDLKQGAFHKATSVDSVSHEGYREYNYCPVCGTFETPDRYDCCPHCKATLIRSAMYADW